MTVIELKPRPDTLLTAQGIQPPPELVFCTGSDGISAMLTVLSQNLIQKDHMAKGGSSQGNKPVVHEQLFRISMRGDQIRKGSVHDQRTSGHIILHQQAG